MKDAQKPLKIDLQSLLGNGLTQAEMVEQRTSDVIRTVRSNYPFPSVIRLCAYLRVPFRKIELSRKNS
jgi:hypothetical protein